MTATNLPNVNMRLSCAHLSSLLIPREYQVTLAGNFCRLLLCHECDPIFNAGGTIHLANGKRVKLPMRLTPEIVEVKPD